MRRVWTNYPTMFALAYDREIRTNGDCLASAVLQSAPTATTVRMRNGKRPIADGERTAGKVNAKSALRCSSPSWSS